MWLFKKKESLVVLKLDLPKLEELARWRKEWAEWHARLPKEFILGSCSGRYPELHFVMDPKTPGLYRAKLDPIVVLPARD